MRSAAATGLRRAEQGDPAEEADGAAVVARLVHGPAGGRLQRHPVGAADLEQAGRRLDVGHARGRQLHGQDRVPAIRVMRRRSAQAPANAMPAATEPSWAPATRPASRSWRR
jgi:hypothetical protein